MKSEQELLKIPFGELIDMGVCPTCLDRRTGGAYFGDQSQKRVFEDKDIECLFVSNPRAAGHIMISTQKHYHDMSEAPDWLNNKLIRFAKQFMKIIKEVFGCERVYICSMSDGPMNHYHLQLIPRYDFEPRGSKNFVKPRGEYVFDQDKFEKVKQKIEQYAKKI